MSECERRIEADATGPSWTRLGPGAAAHPNISGAAFARAGSSS